MISYNLDFFSFSFLFQTSTSISCSDTASPLNRIMRANSRLSINPFPSWNFSCKICDKIHVNLDSEQMTHIVKHLECFPNILLLILILHLELHHHEELGEVYWASAVLVNCIDQVLKSIRDCTSTTSINEDQFVLSFCYLFNLQQPTLTKRVNIVPAVPPQWGCSQLF